jgi:purine-cytosine permease-like protein
MVISRFSVGYVGGTIFAVLNILTQLGFSVLAVIVGGQTLINVSDGKIPLEASIVLTGFMAVVLCFVGYDGESKLSSIFMTTDSAALHYWERYAWILLFVFYCCMYGLGSRQGYDLHAQEALQDTGLAYAGDFLSYGVSLP